MTQTKITFNLDGLDDLRKQMGGTYRARVGIIGDKATQHQTVEKGGKHKGTFRGGETGLTNAEIGINQMFGSVTGKIPPRDFLLMPIQKNQRQIVKQMGRAEVKAAIERRDYKTVYKLLGVAAEAFVLQAFNTAGFGTWPPNAQSTIDAKNSSMPLIHTGQLRRAISTDVVKKGSL